MASLIFSFAATALLGLVAHRLHGARGVLALAPLLAINHLYSTWATSGMESPMTFLLAALALAVASGMGGGVLLGLVAGSCIVHKLDLAPLGLVLLAGTAVWRRTHLRRAVLAASGIVAAWYGFATWHFGSPVPNSFLRKLTADYGSLSPWWFLDNALISGGGLVRLPLAVAGAFALYRRPMLLATALSGVLVPALGYTVKPPPEEFMWYAAATAPFVALLATSGLAWAFGRSEELPGRGSVFLAALLPPLLVAWPLAALESPRTRRWHDYLRCIEPPMIDAGRWVDQNLPADARVLTCWGHPALASKRFAYDGSFLNRRPEEGNLVLKYEPEAWIHSFFGSPEKFRIPRDYRVARRFTSERARFHVLVMLHESVDIPGVPPARSRERMRVAREDLLAELAAGRTPREVAQSPEQRRRLLSALVLERRRMARLSEEQRSAELDAHPWKARLPGWSAELQAREEP